MTQEQIFKNKYFSKKFTKIKSVKNGEMEITRDWYQVLEARAIEISKEHKIFPEKFSKTYGPSYGQSITDDDTIADWLYQYDGNLGQLQKDYPNITMGEIIELFTWNTVCQERAFSMCGVEFVHRMWYPETA